MITWPFWNKVYSKIFLSKISNKLFIYYSWLSLLNKGQLQNIHLKDISLIPLSISSIFPKIDLNWLNILISND